MTPTVFFSWQSDIDKELNTDFIRTALEEAVKEVAVVELPLRVDAAAEGVPGTPDIPSIIFEKLTETAVAVFDVTPILKTKKGKALSNPNVLIELGFAAGLLGWERIILVMNTGTDFKPYQLPFDLRHRRFPICYKSTGKDAKEDRREWTRLTLELKDFVIQALASTHLAVDRARKRLSRDCPHFIEKFGKQPSFHWSNSEHQDELHRMLDLGFLIYDLNPSENLYAYHWTYLGNELCRWYFNRKEIPSAVIEPEHYEAVKILIGSKRG